MKQERRKSFKMGVYFSALYARAYCICVSSALKGTNETTTEMARVHLFNGFLDTYLWIVTYASTFGCMDFRMDLELWCAGLMGMDKRCI